MGKEGHPAQDADLDTLANLEQCPGAADQRSDGSMVRGRWSDVNTKKKANWTVEETLAGHPLTTTRFGAIADKRGIGLISAHTL